MNNILKQYALVMQRIAHDSDIRHVLHCNVHGNHYKRLEFNCKFPGLFSFIVIYFYIISC
jgi:hypothetical protein